MNSCVGASVGAVIELGGCHVLYRSEHVFPLLETVLEIEAPNVMETIAFLVAKSYSFSCVVASFV